MVGDESAPSPKMAPPYRSCRPSAGASVTGPLDRGGHLRRAGGLLTTPAAVAYWGQRTLNDTQRYVDTVGPLVDSPEVQDVIATRVTDAIEQQVDIEAILNDVFAGVITERPRLQRLVGPLSAAINGLIDREVREFIASDEFADLWVRVNTRAQQALLRLLKGEGSGAVSLQGDEVVLDVDEVIDQVKERLVARGLTIVESVPIPETDRQIVLLEAPQLEAAAHDLRVRQPGGPVAAPGRGRALPGRLRAGPASSADDGGDRGAAGGQRRAGGAWRCRSGASCSSTSWRARCSARRAGSSTTPCSPTSSAASRCSSGSASSWSSPAGSPGANKSGTAVRTPWPGAWRASGPASRRPGRRGRRLGPANAGWLRVAAVLLGVVVLFWGNNVSRDALCWSLALVRPAGLHPGPGRSRPNHGALPCPRRRPSKPVADVPLRRWQPDASGVRGSQVTNARENNKHPTTSDHPPRGMILRRG